MASVAVPIATLVLLVLGARDDSSNLVTAATVGLAAVALPWMAGRAARSRRQYLAEVEQRLATAEAERDEQARRAVLDERTHIARELHDVVAHHVSLIGVQAGAARSALTGGIRKVPNQGAYVLSVSVRDVVGQADASRQLPAWRRGCSGITREAARAWLAGRRGGTGDVSAGDGAPELSRLYLVD